METHTVFVFGRPILQHLYYSKIQFTQSYQYLMTKIRTNYP